MKPVIIFALDSNVNIMAAALMYNLGAKPIIGRYRYRKDASLDAYAQEQSWLLPLDLFEEHVLGTDMIEDQESVLQVSGCNKQYAHLRFLKDGVYSGLTEHLGCLKAVPQAEAISNGEWSYDIQMERYFIVVKNSQSEAPAEREQRELWAAIDNFLSAHHRGVQLWPYIEELEKVQRFRPKHLDPTPVPTLIPRSHLQTCFRVN